MPVSTAVVMLAEPNILRACLHTPPGTNSTDNTQKLVLSPNTLGRNFCFVPVERHLQLHDL